jgi:hypothetical protein
MKNKRIFQSDLIVMGDLPSEKRKDFQNGLIVMGDVPK